MNKIITYAKRKLYGLLVSASNLKYRQIKNSEISLSQTKLSNGHSSYGVAKAPFENELKNLLAVDTAWLQETYREYQSAKLAFEPILPAVKSNSKIDDHADKSLDPHEAFAFWCVIKKCQLKSILELGTRYGVSTRFLKIAQLTYFDKREARLFSCDLNKEYRYVDDGDFNFINRDAKTLFPKFLEDENIQCVFNDAHPYDLTKISVQTSINLKTPVIAFHDVGKTHPRSSFKKEAFYAPEEEKNKHLDIHKYGHWERHVMAELFDVKLLDSDYAETSVYKVQIFDSLFGFGVAIKKDALIK